MKESRRGGGTRVAGRYRAAVRFAQRKRKRGMKEGGEGRGQKGQEHRASDVPLHL